MTITINGDTGIAGVDGTASVPAVQGTDTNTGVFYPAADTVGVSTGGSERMRVDSSGNVGIGTSSPAGRLDVVSTSAGGASFMRVVNTSGSANSYAAISLDPGNNGLSVRDAQLRAINNGFNAISLSFLTSNGAPPVEAMRIDSTGNLLVGTTSLTNSSKAIFVGTSTSSSGNQSVAEFRGGGSPENGGQILLYNTYSGVTAPSKWLRVDNSSQFNIVNNAYNTVILLLTDGGNLTISGATATKASGTTWANPSDQRLKDKIKDYNKGLPELMQVRVREWEYNGKGGTTENTKGLGVIADEIMTVLPDTVDTYAAKLNKDDAEETDIKRFDATEITWLLVKAVQQLKAELDALKGTVDAQAEEIAALKATR